MWSLSLEGGLWDSCFSHKGQKYSNSILPLTEILKKNYIFTFSSLLHSFRTCALNMRLSGFFFNKEFNFFFSFLHFQNHTHYSCYHCHSCFHCSFKWYVTTCGKHFVIKLGFILILWKAKTSVSAGSLCFSRQAVNKGLIGLVIFMYAIICLNKNLAIFNR